MQGCILLLHPFQICRYFRLGSTVFFMQLVKLVQPFLDRVQACFAAFGVFQVHRQLLPGIVRRDPGAIQSLYQRFQVPVVAQRVPQTFLGTGQSIQSAAFIVQRSVSLGHIVQDTGAVLQLAVLRLQFFLLPRTQLRLRDFFDLPAVAVQEQFPVRTAVFQLLHPSGCRLVGRITFLIGAQGCRQFGAAGRRQNFQGRLSLQQILILMLAVNIHQHPAQRTQYCQRYRDAVHAALSLAAGI